MPDYEKTLSKEQTLEERHEAPAESGVPFRAIQFRRFAPAWQADSGFRVPSANETLPSRPSVCRLGWKVVFIAMLSGIFNPATTSPSSVAFFDKAFSDLHGH
jgi:hypothetical protein